MRRAAGVVRYSAARAGVKPGPMLSGDGTDLRPAGSVFGAPHRADAAKIVPMIERFIERLLYSSRWLLAPLYLGLALGLFALGIKFFQHAFHAIFHIIEMEEADLVLVVLALIDITLVGSLIVMVMFSGYENFVSRIDTSSEKDTLGWLGKLDSGTLKLKVAASIVAISSIHLLRVFMKLESIDNNKIMWYVILHMTFVFSAVLLGVLDKMSFSSHRESEHEKPAPLGDPTP
jgi:uncharacterized protein (TIGR00645 family)